MHAWQYYKCTHGNNYYLAIRRAEGPSGDNCYWTCQGIERGRVVQHEILQWQPTAGTMVRYWGLAHTDIHTYSYIHQSIIGGIDLSIALSPAELFMRGIFKNLDSFKLTRTPVTSDHAKARKFMTLRSMIHWPRRLNPWAGGVHPRRVSLKPLLPMTGSGTVVAGNTIEVLYPVSGLSHCPGRPAGLPADRLELYLITSDRWVVRKKALG